MMTRPVSIAADDSGSLRPAANRRRLPSNAVDVRSQGRSAVFREAIGPRGVVVEERERTPVEPGAVAIEGRSAALHHLDLWMVSRAQRIPPPRVLGADAAGVVAASRDERWRPGDEAGGYPGTRCWGCAARRAGPPGPCPRVGLP